MFSLPQGPELWIILVIVLLVFGAGRLPELGGALGRTIREFRQSQKEVMEEEVKVATQTEEKAA